MVKIGGNNGDANLIVQALIKGDTPDEVHFLRRRVVNHCRSVVDILEVDIGGHQEVDNNASGAVDGGLQQRRGDGLLGGLFRLALAAGPADAHMGEARVLHHRGDVGEVQVDDSLDVDKVGDALHRLHQHLIRRRKGVDEGDFRIDGPQPLVGDNKEGIHLFLQLGDALLGLADAALALKLKGLGDHADGEDAHIVGNLRNDRRRAGSGAASHAGGDKDHIGAFKGSCNLLPALLGGLLALLRVAAGAHASGELVPNVELVGGAGVTQGLDVRIHRDKFHAAHPTVAHMVHRVAAAAANAYHLNSNHFVEVIIQVDVHFHAPTLLHICQKRFGIFYTIQYYQIFEAESTVPGRNNRFFQNLYLFFYPF